MKHYCIDATIWRWPGTMGWHFISLEKTLSEVLRKKGRVYGSGFIKIQATIGTTSWNTALFPHTQSQTYLLAIKKSVRKKENLFEGDRVTVRFSLQ
jgi:Domain of unknown function (DUF1905)